MYLSCSQFSLPYRLICTYNIVFFLLKVVVSVGFNGACNLTKECDTDLACHETYKLCSKWQASMYI